MSTTSLKPLINIAFRQSLDPPKSPLIRGTKEKTPVPPFLRGARGDLDLMVKQQSLTGFELVVDTKKGTVPIHWNTLYVFFLNKTPMKTRRSPKSLMPPSRRIKRRISLLEIFLMGVETLWSNQVRSGLTMLGVIIGISSVIAITSIAQ